jgi:deoxyadenosine/deoxycytidine kinase
MQRIAQRGRSYERQMERAYIDELNRAYDEFFAGHRQSPVLTIEAEGLDFVANPEDLRAVTDRLQSALGLGAYQTPLML